MSKTQEEKDLMAALSTVLDKKKEQNADKIKKQENKLSILQEQTTNGQKTLDAVNNRKKKAVEASDKAEDILAGLNTSINKAIRKLDNKINLFEEIELKLLSLDKAVLTAQGELKIAQEGSEAIKEAIRKEMRERAAKLIAIVANRGGALQSAFNVLSNELKNYGKNSDTN